MAEQKTKMPGEEQLSKALNEIDVLPNEDQEIVRIDSDTFTFTNVEYKLIENHKEAFDLEMMENRYTDYLLKYDYIVGDISYEKLRLRGFYDNHRRGIPIDMKISNLEDYLVEYCSFGCQYFVFERVDKEENDPDSYFKKKPNTRNENQRKSNKQQNRNQQNRNKQNRDQQNRDQQNRDQQNRNKQNRKKTKSGPNKPKNTNKNDQKKFHVKKKDSTNNNQEVNKSQNNTKEIAKKQSDKKVSFKIRKKTD